MILSPRCFAQGKYTLQKLDPTIQAWRSPPGGFLTPDTRWHLAAEAAAVSEPIPVHVVGTRANSFPGITLN